MHRTRSTYIVVKNHTIHTWQKRREGAGPDRRTDAGHPPLGADRTGRSFGSVSAGKHTCKKKIESSSSDAICEKKFLPRSTSSL